MKKVTSINLNGKAYQMDEDAYEQLKHYLDQAGRTLADDPEKDDVMQDFEQAVAEKCDQFLSEHKNVVSTVQMRSIIKAMGPVELPAEEAKTAASAEPLPPRRLFLLKEGSIIGGVCTGLAAFLKVDVTVVRLIFIVLTVISSGAWILAYILLMLIVPKATTPEEKAAAHGEKWGAQELIDKAKTKYADLREDKPWERAAQAAPAFSRFGEGVLRLVRVMAMAAAIALGLLAALWAVAWIATLWWIATGNLHLYDQLAHIRLWMVFLALGALFYIVFLPITLAAVILRNIAKRRHAGQQERRWGWVSLGLWFAACATFTGLLLANAQSINRFVDTHEYWQTGGHKYCINQELGNGCGHGRNHVCHKYCRFDDNVLY